MLFFQPPVVEPLVHQPNQPMEGVCDEEVQNDLIGGREQDVTMAEEEDQGSMSDKGLIADGGAHDELDVGGGRQQEGAIADGGAHEVN